MAKISPDLQKAMNGSTKAYSAASRDWFGYLTDDVVVFSVSASEPFKGKEAYRRHFTPALTAARRKVSVLHETIQQFDERAVVAQTLQIVQEGLSFNVRQSVVWNQTKSGWKIAHLHSALVGTPSAKVPPTASGIQVLSEKIATIAAVCGVAQ